MEGGKCKGANGSDGCAAERLGMQRNSDQINVRDRVENQENLTSGSCSPISLFPDKSEN